MPATETAVAELLAALGVRTIDELRMCVLVARTALPPDEPEFLKWAAQNSAHPHVRALASYLSDGGGEPYRRDGDGSDGDGAH